MKRVLVIAYFFPPLGGVGIQRTVRLVRHLADIGWEAEVLTVAESSYPYRDEDALGTLPDDLVTHRIHAADPMRLSAALGTSLPGKAARRLLTECAYPLLYVPDRYAPWARAAGMEAALQLASGRFDLVYASLPPYSAAPVVVRAGRAANTPVVLDFRDLWTANHYSRPPRPVLGRHRRLERASIEGAAAIVCATEGVCGVLREQYPERAADMTAVRNGFDSSVVPDDDSSLGGSGLDLVYAGSLYAAYDTESFLKGVARALQNRPDMDLHVDFFGELGSSIRRTVSNLGLDSVVRTMGRSSHADVLRAMAKAAGTLVMLSGGSDIIGVPAKLYDYIGVGKPVLFCGPCGGEAYGIARDSGLSYFADHGDVASCQAAIERMWDDKQAGRLPRGGNREFIETFDMKNQIHQFGEVFDRALSRQP